MAEITQHGGYLSPPGVVSAKVFVYQDGQMGINDYHFAYALSAGTLMTCGEFAGAFADTVKAEYAEYLNPAAQVLGVKVSLMKNTTEALPGIAYVNEVGVGSGDPLPGQVAPLLRANTLLIGRANRGRIYLPFPTEAMGDDPSGPNLVGLAFMTEVRTAVMGFHAVVGSSATISCDYVLWHRGSETFTLVNSFSNSTRWATQRRRGGYGKHNPPIIT